MSDLTFSFDTYFREEFSKDENYKLYHQWIYDQVFRDNPIDKDLQHKIRYVIYESLIAGFWAGEFLKLEYERKLVRLVKVPSGQYKGTIIENLPETNEVIRLLTSLSEQSKNKHLIQACKNKINSIKLQQTIKEHEKEL